VLTPTAIALRTPLTAAERGAARHQAKQQANEIERNFEISFSSFGKNERMEKGVDIVSMMF